MGSTPYLRIEHRLPLPVSRLAFTDSQQPSCIGRDQISMAVCLLTVIKHFFTSQYLAPILLLLVRTFQLALLAFGGQRRFLVVKGITP